MFFRGCAPLFFCVLGQIPASCPDGSVRRYLRLEEPAMTTEQAQQISYLRYEGKSYREIAGMLRLREAAVKTHCSRHGLTDKSIEMLREAKGAAVCPCCGSVIVQIPKQKPRKFCSDKCRYDWWNRNQSLRRNQDEYSHVCAMCGKEFYSYGSKKRKYCSRRCYLAARYGNEGLSADGK